VRIFKGAFVPHKLFSSILLACALFAFPALAQTGAAPKAAASATNKVDVLTPDQAKRALDTLQDDKKRAQMIDTLRAIANASPQAQAAPPAPGPQPAIPLTADSLGAQALADGVRAGRRDLARDRRYGADADELSSVLLLDRANRQRSVRL
jgi:hypothetical protein